MNQRIAILALVGLIFTALSAHAASQKLWSGLGDGVNWSDTNNWIGGMPVAGDGVTFSGGARITNANLGAVAISNITFTSTAGGSSVSGAVTINAAAATINIQNDADATISATVAITNSTLFIKSSVAGKTLTMSGVISGTAGLGVRIYGPGVVTFAQSSNNTYPGITVIASNDSNGSAGILQLNSSSAGSLIPSDINIGGTASGQPADSAQLILLFRDCINNTSILTVNSDGVFNLNGLTETVGGLAGAGHVTSTSGGILSVSNTAAFTFSGSITGAGSFGKSGTGTLTLSGPNSYTGATTVSDGTLILQSPSIFGALTIGDAVGAANSAVVQLAVASGISSASSVTVKIDGKLDLNANTDTIGALSTIGGNVTLGTGALTLNGALNMTGGTLTATGAGSLTLGGTVTATSDATNGAAAITANVVLNATRTFTISPGTTQPELTVTGVVSNGAAASGIFKNGAGTMDFITSTNTFNGLTTIDKGIMRIKATGSTAIQGPVTIGNATDPANSAVLRDLTFGNDIAFNSPVQINASGLLDISTGSLSEHIGPLSGTGNVSLGALTLTLAGDGTVASYGGVIAGTGSLIKSGTGLQTLNGNNTYTGATTILAGTLEIDGAQPASNITVTGGTLAGSGSVGNVTSAAGINPGSATPGMLSTKNITMTGGTYTVDLAAPTANGFDFLSATGTVAVAGALTITPASTFAAPIGTKIVVISNDGADAISGVFTGVPEGTVVTSGAAMFKVSYIGGSGNDVELTVLNAIPVVNSPATASPPVAGTGQVVTFNIAVFDGNGDPLTYAWNFGDGSTGTGASPTHQYVSAGTYSVSVTITDGNGGSASSSTSVTVNGPLVGMGSDSDNDGFSDTFEIAYGTSPLNAAAVPFPLAAAKPISPATISAKLNFLKTNSDSFAIGGTIPVPAGFVVNGAKFALLFGNFVQVFKLDAHGKAKSGGAQASVAIKSKKGVVAAQSSKFSIKLSKFNLRADLALLGLTNANATKTPVTLAVQLVFADTLYSATVAEHYSAKQGKSGATSK